MEYPKHQLDYFASLVYDNEQSFLKKFAGDSDTLVSIHFGYSEVRVCYILESGQYVVDSFKLDRFIEWCDGL